MGSGFVVLDGSVGGVDGAFFSGQPSAASAAGTGRVVGLILGMSGQGGFGHAGGHAATDFVRGAFDVAERVAVGMVDQVVGLGAKQGERGGGDAVQLFVRRFCEGHGDLGNLGRDFAAVERRQK